MSYLKLSASSSSLQGAASLFSSLFSCFLRKGNWDCVALTQLAVVQSALWPKVWIQFSLLLEGFGPTHLSANYPKLSVYVLGWVSVFFTVLAIAELFSLHATFIRKYKASRRSWQWNSSVGQMCIFRMFRSFLTVPSGISVANLVLIAKLFRVVFTKYKKPAKPCLSWDCSCCAGLLK